MESSKLTFKKIIKYIINSREEYGSTYFTMIKDYVKPEYIMLEDPNLTMVWNGIVKYTELYNKIPNYQEVTNIIYFDNKNIKSNIITNIIKDIKSQDISVITNNDKFAKDITQDFIKDKATEHILTSSARLFIDKDNKISLDNKIRQITEWFDEISAISLNPDLGDEYISTAKDRHKKLSMKVDKVPFALNYLNNCTLGGTELGRLTVYFLSSGVGKTMLMSNDVAYLLKNTDHKIIYISLEDASIQGRVDQNLLDKTKEELTDMDEEEFLESIHLLDQKYNLKNRFIFKKFPSRSVTVNQIKAFIKEIHLKKDFKASTVFIDYLNLIKETKGKSLYEIYGFISAELKGVADELNIDLRTATQTNRNGYANKSAKMVTDIFLSEMADSIAVVFNSDLVIGGFTNQILKNKNQMVIKMLKNRIYGIIDILSFTNTNIDKQKVWDENIPIAEMMNDDKNEMLNELNDTDDKDWSKVLNALEINGR